jgi:hypothetical protein
MAGCADERAEIAVQFGGCEAWVRRWVEGVDVCANLMCQFRLCSGSSSEMRSGVLLARTLCYDSVHVSQLSEIPNRFVPSVWHCFGQIRPAQETTSPVALPRFVVCAELVVVYRSVCSVQSVCPLCASVVCEP